MAAIPQPAEPAPTMSTGVSAKVLPACCKPASTQAEATAAVPWMSSLNMQSSFR
ncbi:hypothetical protein D3C72_471670 [compost metagenome]